MAKVNEYLYENDDEDEEYVAEDGSYSSDSEIDLFKIKTPPSYDCEFCQKPFLSILLKRKHIHLNHYEEMIEEERKKKVKRNAKKSKPKNSSSAGLFCKICSQKFFTDVFYQKHMLQHKAKDKATGITQDLGRANIDEYVIPDLDDQSVLGKKSIIF